ncbi:site-specific integrase [Luteipulveratus halotolerans]|uniref:site-specific integrase n=1 Tax=Luteipulveratus halotolerans TaxID=1631356 RepID=UPI0018D1D859|nr:tyrosine-type recombinase/integrase [Luteipulveratus halotolerans]
MPKVMPEGSRLYTVVDQGGTSYEDVDTYLNYLHALDFSPNTIRSYARHLALLFRWLDQRGAAWDELSFDGLCTFGADLADGTLRSVARHGEFRPTEPRSRATCEAVMAAVYSYLDYWKLEGRGPADLRLYREGTNRRTTTYSFLAHVAHQRPRQQRRVRFRGPKPQGPHIINFEDDFQRLLNAAKTHRDKALLSAMYDGGLRISQALGLHHEDIDIARKRVRGLLHEQVTSDLACP